MKKTILFVLLAIVLLGEIILYLSCNGKAPEETWRTDRSPIEKRFSVIGKFECCWWQGGTLGKDSFLSVPGPSTYFIKAYVILSPSDAQHIEKEYKWEKSTDTIIVPKHLGFIVSGKWMTSDGFSSAIKSSSDFKAGKVYYLPERRLVFLYFETI